MKQVGYARVSTTGQDLTTQVGELSAAGCKKIYQDKASGKNTDRPDFLEMMKAVNEGLIGDGDYIVITKLDRMGRDTVDLLNIVEALKAHGVGLRILDFMGDSVDTGSPQGKMMLTVFAAMAEYERSLILERTAKGREAAKAKGKTGGRKRSISEKKIESINTLIEDGTEVGEACNQLGISRASYYRLKNN